MRTAYHADREVEVYQRDVLERAARRLNAECPRGRCGPGSIRVCSWESSQPPTLADGVRILALVLADVARLVVSPRAQMKRRLGDSGAIEFYLKHRRRGANVSHSLRQ